MELRMSAVLTNLLNRPTRTIDLVRTGNLEAVIASDPADIRAAQRLRRVVFSQTGGASTDAIDQDPFDAFCDHLIVRTRDDGRIVGNYRILRPEQARRIGRYYTEGEFDLRELAPIRADLVELGRSCVDPAWRSGPVIMLLWSALGEYLRRRSARWVIGCVSIPAHDGGHLAASIHRDLRCRERNVRWKVTPRNRLPVERLYDQLDTVYPPLLKGYLRAGARLIGEPHLDTSMQCADLPMLLELERAEPRYVRRFFAPLLSSTA
jgi:putative hemolysin